MKVCFIGLGSIATRHIKNLYDILDGKVQIDVFRSGNGGGIDEEIKAYISDIFMDMKEMPKDYDVIFITNPTKLHYETLQKFHSFGRNFFIEKPVFETGEEQIKNLNLRLDSVYYVACPLRYTNVIQYLKKNVDFNKIYSIRCISSSYLPEWRPGVDYRNTYSAKKELGGGVSIDLIHEWDYLTYLLGYPQKAFNLKGKKSNLEIDSEDCSIYIAEYEKMFVELHLDYFGRVPIRKLELLGEDDTIVADLLKQQIHMLKEDRIVDLYEDRNSFQKKELEFFLEILKEPLKNSNTIEKACKTLKITRGEN